MIGSKRKCVIRTTRASRGHERLTIAGVKRDGQAQGPDSTYQVSKSGVATDSAASATRDCLT